MECPDLKAYVLGELNRSEQEAVRLHLAGCNVCRVESERLERTTAALRMLPEQEIPVHVRFISDKIFEPWWRRWRLSPGWAFASALLSVVLIFDVPRFVSQRPQTAVLPQAFSALNANDIQKRIDVAVHAQVKAEVALAEAQIEQSNNERTLAMLANFRQQSQTDQKRLVQAVEAEYETVDQKINQAVFAANEKLPVLNQ